MSQLHLTVHATGNLSRVLSWSNSHNFYTNLNLYRQCHTSFNRTAGPNKESEWKKRFPPIMCQVIYHRDRDRSVSQPNHNHQRHDPAVCMEQPIIVPMSIFCEMHHFELIVFSPIHPWWMYDTDTGQEIWFSLWNHTFFPTLDKVASWK